MRCNPIGASTISRKEMQDSEDSQPNAPEHHVRRADHGSHQAAAPSEMINAPGPYRLGLLERCHDRQQRVALLATV
jgi:hypothetical protein